MANLATKIKLYAKSQGISNIDFTQDVKLQNNNIIRATRQANYGNIGDQLDEIYKDIDAWKARIKSIKDANPKE